MNFKLKKLLKLDNRIVEYLDQETREDLHVLKGKDYSDVITIKNLLAHTSGIPDYFQGKDQEGISVRKNAVSC